MFNVYMALVAFERGKPEQGGDGSSGCRVALQELIWVLKRPRPSPKRPEEVWRRPHPEEISGDEHSRGRPDRRPRSQDREPQESGRYRPAFRTRWVENFTAMKRSKARALIQIYNAIADSGTTWAEIKHVGWTKLRAVARVLNKEKAVYWIAVASK
jgi:hypothetical protein